MSKKKQNKDKAKTKQNIPNVHDKFFKSDCRCRDFLPHRSGSKFYGLFNYQDTPILNLDSSDLGIFGLKVDSIQKSVNLTNPNSEIITQILYRSFHSHSIVAICYQYLETRDKRW